MTSRILPTTAIALLGWGASACSDTPKEPPQAAMGIEITGGNRCGVSNRLGGLGTPLPGSERIIQGDDGVSVSCAVIQEESGAFTFTGTQRAEGGDSLSVRSLEPIQPGGAARSNIVGFVLPLASLQSPTDVPCTVTLNPSDPLLAGRGGDFGIQPGAIYAGFHCEEFTDPTTPDGRMCGARGTFIFENCEGL